MLTKNNITKAVIATTILTFTGCQKQAPLPQSFNQANGYFQNQDYKKAIEYYQKALQKLPENKQIQQKLSQAKKLYVSSSITNAKGVLESKQIISMQKLLSQQTTLQNLSSFDKNNENQETIQKLLGDTKAKITTLQELITSLKSQIDTDMMALNFTDVLKKLNKLKTYDESIKNSQYEDKILTNLDNYYLKNITNLLMSNKLQEAINEYNAYIKISTNDKNIQIAKEKINRCKKVNTLLYEANQYLGSLRLDDAYNSYFTLTTMEVASGILQKDIRKFERTLTRKLIDFVQESLNDGNLDDAYNYALKASNIKKNVKMTTSVKEVLQQLYAKAKEFTELSLDGNAYALYEKIQAIDPNYKSTFILHRDIKDKLIKRNILKLAVSEFVTPNLDRSAGSRFSASLTSELFKKTQKNLKDVNVIERNRLKAILDELKLRETGNLESLAQRGKIKGINVFIFGDIIESSVEPQRRESSEQIMVKIGTRKVNNSQFMAYMMASDEQKRKWRKIPDEFIEEPVNQLVSYRKGEIKKTANFIASVRIVNIEKGEIVAAETLETQKIVKDRYNDGVALANIEQDDEQIPSDRTLIKDLHSSMVEKTSDFILKPFQNRELEKISQADTFIERREYNKALESLIDSKLISEIKGLKIDQTLQTKIDQLFKKVI